MTAKLAKPFPETTRLSSSQSVITLRTMFQIVTACAVFFAVLRLSPLAALVLAVFVAPAIIRTAWVSDLYARSRVSFDWSTRLWFFLGSIGIVMFAFGCGAVAFVGISLSFGLVGILFSLAVSSGEFYFSSGVIGAVCGMTWGMAGAWVTIVYVGIKSWHPKINQESKPEFQIRPTGPVHGLVD